MSQRGLKSFLEIYVLVTGKLLEDTDYLRAAYTNGQLLEVIERYSAQFEKTDEDLT